LINLDLDIITKLKINIVQVSTLIKYVMALMGNLNASGHK